ncbi:hypothetical protein IAU60_006198 [Kwoniella sp. DSM 27419]
MQAPIGKQATTESDGHDASRSSAPSPSEQSRYSQDQEVMIEDRYRRTHGEAGYEYAAGYTGEHYADPYDQARSTSPSLGPWDSASQRSFSQHPGQASQSSLPRATLAPVSAGDGSSGGQHRKAQSYGGLSYIDEEGVYYHTDQPRPASVTSSMKDPDGLEMGLIRDAATMSGHEEATPTTRYNAYEGMPYPSQSKDSHGDLQLRRPNELYDLLLFPTGLDRVLAMVGMDHCQYPVEQAIERKKRGLSGQRWPVASWALTAVMTGLLIYELVANYQATGSPIATKPSFNYMIGPSSEVLINIGARFPPCMKLVQDLPPTFQLACLNDTANPPTTSCSLEEICGHGGFPNGTPDQSWRFFVPIFLHVGVIHLLLNMVVQITAAAQVEREMGTIPFLVVYFAGGIYGFVLGGNFSRIGIPSVGASGALFATNACVLVDLVLHWRYEERPKLKAFLLAVEFLIGFGIGYIPNAVDGLAHLGGWAIGILLGIILYPSISETKRHRHILWGVRLAALVLTILAFVLTSKNFCQSSSSLAPPGPC